jgi:fumarate reductase subunit D
VPEPARSGREPDRPPGQPPGRINVGPGRVLLLVYGVFALSASVRAGYQLATKFHRAPMAYGLSALAAAIYVVATVALAQGGPIARRVALTACTVELVGVLAVGTWSLADPERFPEPTVWSGFGQGYGYVPLVLPMLGLWWLIRAGRPV